ncbi:MAG: DUF4974 domain-containing protein [Butyricimonas faecihominis]
MNGEKVVLTPGKQALLQGKEMTVREVNTKLYTLWRLDRFTFASEDMEGVIRKLSRWYNVEFFFESFDETKTIHGVITEICGYMSGVEDDRDDHGYKIRDKGAYNHDTIKIQEMQRTFPV